MYSFEINKLRMIYIISRRSVKVPGYGERWNDRSIEDGINLLNFLSVAKEEGVALANMEYVDVRWKTPLAKRVSTR